MARRGINNAETMVVGAAQVLDGLVRIGSLGGWRPRLALRAAAWGARRAAARFDEVYG